MDTIMLLLAMLLSGMTFTEIILYSLLFLIIFIFVIILFKNLFASIRNFHRLRKKQLYADPTENAPEDAPSKVAPPEFKQYNGAGYLAYQYQCVWFSLCTDNIPKSYIHKPIEFSRDADGITVCCESKKIGVLNPHKITDMISDWLDRDESYSAFLTAIFTDDMEGSFNIAFYRDELAYAFRKYDEYKQFKLIGTRSDEIAETANHSNEGEKCTVDYDPAHDKYAVYDEYSNIMGFLPSAGVRYYQEHDEECVSFISRVDYDEVDQHVILYVTLFAK